MKRTFRTITALALILCMAVSLCACGKSTPAAKGSVAATPEPEFTYAAEFTSIRKDSSDSSMPIFMADGILYLIGREKIGEREHGDDKASYEGQYDIMVPTLATSDLNGNKTELSEYAPIEPEDENAGKRDYAISRSIEKMCLDKDGNLWIMETHFASWSDAPADIKETDASFGDYYRSSEKHYLRSLDKTSGADLHSAELDISELGPDKQLQVYGDSMVFDTSGNLILNSDTYVIAFAPDGSLAYEVDCEGYVYSIVTTADGSVGVTRYNDAAMSMELSLLDGDTGRFLDKSYKLPLDAYTLLNGGGEYDLYYTSGVSFFGYKIADESTEKLFSWVSCDVDSNSLALVTANDDGSICALSGGHDEKTDKYNIDYVEISKVPYNSVPHKESLRLATFYTDDITQKTVIEFNRSNDSYRIDVVDYSEYNTSDDYSAGITKLTTEIMAGNVPDIISVGSSLPYRQLASKGILEDLYPYIDADSEFKREDFFENVFSALEVNGGLYTACAGYGIITAAAASQIVGDTPGWDYDAFYEAIAQMPEGCYALDYGYNREELLSICLALEMDSFVDWSSGKCNFDTPEFIEMLEFVNYDNREVDFSEYDPKSDSSEARIAEGKQLMAVATFISPDYFYTDLDKTFGGKATLIGFPTSHGIGSMISPVDCVSMSASCKNKDVAWQFVRRLFTEEYQLEGFYLATNKNAFEKQIEKAMTVEYLQDENGKYLLDENGERIKRSRGTVYDGQNTYEIYAATEEQAQQLRDVVNNTSKLMSSDTSIGKIVTEGTAPYFEGQKTAEECAKLIQSKANIYVNEQR